MAISWIDLVVVIVPLAIIVWLSLKARQVASGVKDFLSAGQRAGRYLISVADGAAGLGLITVIAQFEMNYKSGFAIGFWWNLITLFSLVMTLTGFVIYRYRQTEVLTMAEFYEKRYSRGFRIYAGCLAFISGVVNYAIFPSVSAHFVIYYCGLPFHIDLLGMQVETYGLLMALFLGVALFIVMLGGQVTNIVSDCCQGIFGYFAYGIITAVILYSFRMEDIHEAVMSRPDGMSFFNPFNVDKLTTFNLLYIIIALISSIYNRNAWLGNQGYMCSGANPHEQKMAGVLGTWRAGYLTLALMLMVIGAYAYMNCQRFASDASSVHQELALRTAEEYPIYDGATASDIKVIQKASSTISNQMLVPLALRQILPVGVVGCFLAMMLFLMVSTDTTYMHSWGTILVQDVILPIYNRPISESVRLALLRGGIVCIAVFAWFFSRFFMQNDYILQFMAMTATIYLGGAGACMIGGLYWKRGNTAGAYAAMTIGCLFAVGGFFLNNKWGTLVYPWLYKKHPDFLETFRQGLEHLGRILPFANWDTSIECFSVTFPISAKEIYLAGMIFSMLGYVSFSLMMSKGKTFDLDGMLHRTQVKENKRSVFQKILGITDEYSRGDRVIAWSVFLYVMYKFVFFLVEAVWNLIPGCRWQEETWFNIWKYYELPFALLVGAVTTVWFTYGGIRDLRRLLRKD